MALANKETNTSTYPTLHGKWDIYYHLPNDKNWELSSYKILTKNLNDVDELIAFNEYLPEKIVKYCMLFVMREGINPTWEDPQNAKGGCFSYKISNASVNNVWTKLSYTLVGESLISKTNKNNITGITISPKKNFCIIKIWMSDCNNQDPTTISYFEGIDSRGCLFKKHNPEY